VYFIKGGSDVRVKGYVTDAAGTAFPLGIIDEDDVRSVKLDGFTVGSNTAINSDNSIFTAFRNTQAQLNSLSTAVAGGIKIPLPIDCSSNPNYPPAAAGDSYLVTVGGKIGGASGILVRAGDKIIAQQTNAGGNQATVGSAWYIIQGNIDLATTDTPGITRIATDTETNAGSENFAYVTPSTLRGGVRNTTLTGYAVGSNAALAATDTVLGAFGKVQGQLNAKEAAFTKNTAFNKNFGTAAGTVAEGNDSRFHDAVSLGTPNGLSLIEQALSLGLASTSANGALSSTDWNTFNNKQSALTNPVTGTGVAGQVSFWNGVNTQAGNSNFIWDNTNFRITSRALTVFGGTGSSYSESLSGEGSLIIQGSSRTLGNNTAQLGLGRQIVFREETDPRYSGSLVQNVAVIRAEYDTSGTDTISGSHALTFSTFRGWGGPSGGVLLEKWRITSTGILQSNGAQTIQTSTGNLTLATAAGNGNIILSPHGTGSVGIGTSTPVNKLSIVGGNGNQLVLDNTGQQFTQIDFNNNGSTQSRIWNNGSGNLFTLQVGSGRGISFQTDGTTERMRITSTGNVGIGTDSPGAKTEIVNNFNRVLKVTQQATTLSSAAYTFEVDSASHSSNTSAAGAMNVTVNSGVAFTINGLGRVGIGTTTPNSKLEVAGNAAIGYTTAAPTNGLIVSGNVGIGTTSFTPKLAVSLLGSTAIGVYANPTAYNSRFEPPAIYGTIRLGGGDLQANKDYAGIIGVARVDSGGTPEVGNRVFGVLASVSNGYGAAANTFAFGAIGTSLFDGNVGIGITTPARLLHVAGAIRITGTAAPATPAEGDQYFDSTSKRMRFRRTSDWIDMGMFWESAAW
jgi:hypothetical protein